MIHSPFLSHNPDPITQGQGEYVVFYQSQNGERKELSQETYNQVFKTLTEYSPGALAVNNRYAHLMEKIKHLDPNLEAVFIPKTLYELVFIRKCIKEDIKNKNICPGLDKSEQKFMMNLDKGKGYYLPDEMRKIYRDEIEAFRAKRKCWHLSYFEDAGDNEHPGVRNVAYRLNQVLVKTFAPSSKGFTHRELSAFVEQEIKFLKEYHSAGGHLYDPTTPGPTTNFSSELFKGYIAPMGLRSETDAQIIRDAAALECSKIAEHSYILYRGANFAEDICTARNNENVPYSLSFGASLFAGCIFDGGATAFYFMRNKQNAYAISVPFEQFINSPFYFPATHAVAQLFSTGEVFHARTKAWNDFNPDGLKGINMGENSNMRAHLISNLSKDDFLAQFQKYKNSAFILK